MSVAAPPGMQQFITSTDSRLRGLEEQAANIDYTLRQRPAPDRAVFVDGPTHTGPRGTSQVFYPQGASVVHTNTTGLVEVTVSATLRTFAFGGAGVGVYFDELAPTIMNNAPKYGIAHRSENPSQQTVTGASYTTVFPVRPGTRTFSLYYYTYNIPENSQSSIDLATIIVRSI